MLDKELYVRKFSQNNFFYASSGQRVQFLLKTKET